MQLVKRWTTRKCAPCRFSCFRSGAGPWLSFDLALGHLPLSLPHAPFPVPHEMPPLLDRLAKAYNCSNYGYSTGEPHFLM